VNFPCLIFTHSHADVRGLFADGVIPLPKKTNYELTVGRSLVDLRFVNRKTELLNSWAWCADNTTTDMVKHYTLVSGQMWGSGKTTFGRQLFNFQNADTSCNPTSGQIAKHHIHDIDVLFRDELKIDPTYKVILSNTLPVFVDLQGFKRDKFESTAELVSMSIFVATLSQYFNVTINVAKEFWNRNMKLLSTPDYCARLLLSMAQKPLFFHFDEVGLLTDMEPSFKKQPPENGEVKGVFYQFWDSVLNVQIAGCFAYISGKSSVLNFFGTHEGEHGTVGQVAHLRLSLFKVEDLRDIFWDKEPTTIGARLKITTQEEAERVAKWMHHLTTGVPRYVERSLAEMIKMADETTDSINWGDSHKETISSILEKNPFLFPRLDGRRTNEIEWLVRLAKRLEHIRPRDTIPGKEEMIIDLVRFYGFYIDAVENSIEDRFRIRIPRLWIKAGVFDRFSGAKSLFYPPIDHPQALENHVQETILEFSQELPGGTKTVGDRIKILSNTLVANVVFPPLVVVRMDRKASKHNRQETFTDCIDLALPYCSLVRPMDKSSLPDLITVLPISDEGDRYLIGWQMKNYRKTELGVSSLHVELDKFTSHLSGQGCKGGVFVIVLNGKGDETVERFRGKVITSEDTEATNALGITLPSNVQVVIPTLEQLGDFLGEEALETLSKQILVTGIEKLLPEFGESAPLPLMHYKFLVRMSDGSVVARSYQHVRDSKEFKEFLKTTDAQVQSHFLKNRTAQAKATYFETPGMSLNETEERRGESR
jgi:hypothetical protein